MPSNRRNTRKPLDTEVSQKLEEFEYNFCKYVDDAMPKKFRDMFVKQILLALGEAAELMLKGLRKDKTLFAAQKLDCCVVVTDKAKWLADRRRLALMVREKGLTLHPDKVYLQHYSKGVEMLGYKLRFGRMLPSDRIVHNFKWKTQCAARRLEARANWYDLEGLQQTVNSYLGLLGWCNSY